MNKVAGIVIEIATDIARIQSDMGKAVTLYEKGTRKISNMAKSIGISLGAAFTARGVVSWIGSATEAMATTYKLSQSLGVTTESFSELEYAAKLADLPTEDLSTGIRALIKNLMGVGGPTKEASAALRSIGVDANAGNDVGSWIRAIADGMQRMPDGAEKASAAMALFGKTGTSWIPLLNGGAEGLRQMGEEADKLGVRLSTKAAKDAEAFRDELDRLKTSADGLGRSLAVAVAPAATRFLETMRREFSAGNYLSAFGVGVGAALSDRMALEAEGSLRSRLALVEKEAKDLAARIRKGVEQQQGLFGSLVVDKAKLEEAYQKHAGLVRLADELRQKLQEQADVEREKARILAEEGAQRRQAAREEGEHAAARATYLEVLEAEAKAYKVQLDDQVRAEAAAARARQARLAAQLQAEKDARDYRLGELEMEMSAYKAQLDAEVEADKDRARKHKEAYDRMTSTVRQYADQCGEWLVNVAKTGKLSFHDMAASIVADLLKMQASRLIFQPILGGLASAITGVHPPASGTATPKMAGGGVILRRPTLLADGAAIGGEAGRSEGVFPLQQGPRGLGIAAYGGSGVTVQIVDQRSGGAPVAVSESSGPNGERIIRALITDQHQRDVASGRMDRLYGESFGLRRQGVRR